jgi:hypothetical protein
MGLCERGHCAGEGITTENGASYRDSGDERERPLGKAACIRDAHVDWHIARDAKEPARLAWSYGIWHTFCKTIDDDLELIVQRSGLGFGIAARQWCQCSIAARSIGTNAVVEQGMWLAACKSQKLWGMKRIYWMTGPAAQVSNGHRGL